LSAGTGLAALGVFNEFPLLGVILLFAAGVLAVSAFVNVDAWRAVQSFEPPSPSSRQERASPPTVLTMMDQSKAAEAAGQGVVDPEVGDESPGRGVIGK